MKCIIPDVYCVVCAELLGRGRVFHPDAVRLVLSCLFRPALPCLALPLSREPSPLQSCLWFTGFQVYD